MNILSLIPKENKKKQFYMFVENTDQLCMFHKDICKHVFYFGKIFHSLTYPFAKCPYKKKIKYFFFVYHHVIYHVIIVSNYNANIFIINSVTFIWINKIYAGKKSSFFCFQWKYSMFFFLKMSKRHWSLNE